MKKILLLSVFLLPLVGFSFVDDYVTNGIRQVRIFRYTAASATSLDYVSPDCYDRNSLLIAFQNFPFGLRFDPNDGFVKNPAIYVSPTRPTVWGVDNQVSLYTNSTSAANFSPRDISYLNDLYVLAFSLYCSGYRGPGFSFSSVSGRYVYLNFDYRSAVSDILCSTNTVFRGLLLNHLSTISASVQNIELNVSGLQSSVDLGNSLLSDVNSNVVNISSAVVGGFDSVSSNLVNISDRMSPDPFVLDFTNAVLKLYDDIGTSWSSQHVDYLLSYYSRLDNDVSRVLFAREVSNEVRDLGFMSYFNSKFGTPLLGVLGDPGPDSLGSKGSTPRGLAGDVRTTKLQLQQWKQQAQQQLQDWKDDLRQQLQDWKTSDERGILNIRDDIRGNFSYRGPSGSTNDLPFTSFVTNFVTHVITNTIVQSSGAISSNIVDQAEKTRKLFDDKLFDPNSDGVNVRIKWPLRYESSSEVNVHDQALDDILGNLHDYSTTMSNLVEGALLEFKNNLTSTNSIDWEPWFEKWGIYADIVTNFYAQFNASSPVADLADRFLSEGFDSEAYGELPWFSRVEVLLAMMAGVSTNSVDVADISEELDGLVDEFSGLGTNVVSSSESFVGLFDYVRRTADRFKSVFGDRSSPVTDGGIVLLSSGSWIGNEPLVLKVNSTVQNVLRLFFRCFWLLSALVVVWLVVSWSWQKVVAVLRWLWSMFEL